jgi:hypothetical protein
MKSRKAAEGPSLFVDLDVGHSRHSRNGSTEGRSSAGASLNITTTANDLTAVAVLIEVLVVAVLNFSALVSGEREVQLNVVPQSDLEAERLRVDDVLGGVRTHAQSALRVVFGVVVVVLLEVSGLAVGVELSGVSGHLNVVVLTVASQVTY